MPLYIKDDTTARLVSELAQLRGISKQDAVKLAVIRGRLLLACLSCQRSVGSHSGCRLPRSS